MRALSFVMFAVWGQCSAAETPVLPAAVTTFPALPEAPLSTRYRVAVRAADSKEAWQPVPIYDFMDTHLYNRQPTAEYHVGVFVARGPVEVRVTLPTGSKTATVRPLSRDHATGFDAEQSAVRFAMNDVHRQVWLDVDGDLYQPLVLASSPPDGGPRDGALVYGPGYHRAGVIAPESGACVYIAGGAVVEGRFEFENRQDITISGPGIVFTPDRQAVLAKQSSHIAIRDVTFIKRGEAWGIMPLGSDHVTIDNVKFMSEVRDGIDPVNSQQVTVRNCFIGSHDDAMSPKGTHRGYGEPCEDILYENIVIAQMGLGNPLRLGVEANAPAMRRMTFRNITVVHALKRKPSNKLGNWPDAVICIDKSAMQWVGDVDCPLSDVLCEHWIIENNRKDCLINIRPLQIQGDKVFGSTPRQGMSDITIRDIDVVAGAWRPSRVHGHENGRIERVRFVDIKERGKQKASLAEAGIDVNRYATEVSLEVGIPDGHDKVPDRSAPIVGEPE